MGPKTTVREHIHGSGYGEQRQDDDSNTLYNTKYKCVIPTYRYTESFHKKVSVSNIVERQRYTTVNRLTQQCKNKSNNLEMIIIEDAPPGATKMNKQQKQKTKPVIQLFAGNISSLSEKMREYLISQHKNYSIWNLVETHERNEKNTFSKPWI